MDEKQTKLVERVLAKVSTLRSALQEDEQGVLDQLILSSQLDEVAAHGLTSLPDEVKQGLTSKPATSKAISSSPDEVSAHGMTSGPDDVKYGVTSKAVSSKAASSKAISSSPDEVSAHGMTSRPDEANTAKVFNYRFSLDHQDKTYKLVK